MRDRAAFARHHPALCLAPGLFLSLKKGARETDAEPRVLATQTLDGAEHVFEGPGPLGVDDLRALQGVYMLASRPSANVSLETSAPRSETGLALAAGLEVWASPGESTLAKFVACSMASVADAAGYDGSAGGPRRLMAEALDRLSGIRVSVVRDGTVLVRSRLLAKSPLLGADEGGSRDTTALALAPSLSTVVLTGAKGVRHCRLEWSEISALGTGGAIRALHQRLCAFVDPGKAHKVALRTLLRYAYGETDVRNTARRRASDVRAAMAEIGTLPGWRVTDDGEEGEARVFLVRRPAARRPGDDPGTETPPSA